MNQFNDFIDHVERNNEPFSWPHRISKTITDSQIPLGVGKNSMKKILKFRMVDSGRIFRLKFKAWG